MFGLRLFVLSALLSIVVGCQKSICVPDNGALLSENIHMLLAEGDPSLDGHVQTDNRASLLQAPLDWNANNVGRILPVTVNDSVVEIQDVLKTDQYAFVAYSAKGPSYAGALEVFNLADPAKPRLLAQVQFLNMEVNALYFDQATKTLVLGGQADGNYFGFYSWVSKLNVDQLSSKSLVANLTRLGSYGVTAIGKKGGRFYVSTEASAAMLDQEIHFTGA